MDTAKLKMEGNHQVIILPDHCHLEGDEVCFKQVGNTLILISKSNPYQSLWDSLELFSEDFMDERVQPTLAKKEDLF
jgi:antitoxin VapB